MKVSRTEIGSPGQYDSNWQAKVYHGIVWYDGVLPHHGHTYRSAGLSYKLSAVGLATMISENWLNLLVHTYTLGNFLGNNWLLTPTKA